MLATVLVRGPHLGQGLSQSVLHARHSPFIKELAMRLTTKGRFAVTAMIDLALRQNNGPVTLAAISQRQQISLSYLCLLYTSPSPRD